MEDLITEKKLLIERVVALTARLAELVMGGDSDAVDNVLQERHSLIENLCDVNERLGKKVTKYDSSWQKQFEYIRCLEDKIRENIRNHQQHLHTELKHLGYAKTDFLKSNQVSSKGQALRVKA